MVKLYRENIHKTVLAARIVATTFLGPCPEGMEVCHGDGNRQNSRLDNLRWDTHQANMMDSIRHGTNHCLTNFGERHGQHKLTDEQIREIRNIGDRLKLREISATYGISVGQVSNILYGNCRRSAVDSDRLK